MARRKLKNRTKRPGRRKTGITWAAIRKANKKRKTSGLEKKFHKLLNKLEIEYKTEKCVGRCHADVFIKPNILIEVQGCYFHACDRCFPKPSKRQKEALVRDMKRFKFFRDKGFKVIALWGCDIMKSPDECMEQVMIAIADSLNGK